MRAPIAFIFLAACAVHVRGVVQPTEGGISLLEPEGRLRGVEPVSIQGAELQYLDGEEVTVHGRAAGRMIKVERWELHAGTHGIQAFVGLIGQSPRGLGIHDRTSQAFYTVDSDAGDEIVGWLGQPMLIEGYVEGAQALHVVYYRPLADLETAQ